MRHNFWRNRHRNRSPKSQRSILPSLKWAIIWITIQSFSVWLMSYFLIVITNGLLYLILAGLGITIIAIIMRTITRHETFRVNKNFVFWFCITTFSFWIMRLILQLVQIQGGVMYYILMGCGIFAIGQIVQKIRYFLPRGTNNRNKTRDPEKTKPTTQPNVHANAANKIILDMVNRERRKRHLIPVIYDRALELHAIRWSNYMAHQKRLSHSGSILENVCMVSANGSSNTITKEMFYCWKKSPPHWNWMMNPQITKAGFGYKVRDKYAYGAYAFNNPQ